MSSVLQAEAGRNRLRRDQFEQSAGPQRNVLRPAAPIPSPKRLGFFGAIRALANNPLSAFAAPAYEAPVLEVTFLKRMLLVSDPDAIARILVGNAGNYRKSVQQQRRLTPALGDGLLTAEGETWRSTRRIASPLFTPKAIEALLGDMRGAADAMAARWRDRKAPDTPLDLTAEFQRLTYDIVSRTVFSGALDEHRINIHANMAVYFDTIGRIDLASLLNLPDWLPTRNARRVKPALGAFRAVVDEVVAARVADPDRESADLLDRLMQSPDPKTGKRLSPTAVADNVLTFLAAGHETTGNALGWILYLLALDPETETRMREELEALPGGVASREAMDLLPFTRAAVNEALRLYPPAPFMGREAIGADTLAGHDVKPGTEILISPWIVHRHRALWEEPDAFNPERFLGQKEADFPRGAYLPFGLGPRVCIGQGFAIQEILTVLAAILPAFRFRLADTAAIVPEARITLRSRGGIPMIVSPR
ncbi:cytochrome P450 [Methyloligella sp. 2.7D]|uniref:cytochrome P450 n=1 Tax=unclassified Methyloligella TaxID=2625955 RepID=UPI00157BE3BB|nr:cytochrome P450 [Methyloligella sp. GL2]QKP77248.1 cytochrome P450 [Methyloligella sp. GL2]